MEVRVNLGERHGESVVATHSCSVQSEMLNEAHAKKKTKQNKTKKIYIYILRDIHRYQGKRG